MYVCMHVNMFSAINSIMERFQGAEKRNVKINSTNKKLLKVGETKRVKEEN